ncbi:MAG: HAMP domain-containing histidine kinase, partial [Myxococcales bacterium]|nr:HAMP domain-containing histidine kinase [Myxococcales bacterium]
DPPRADDVVREVRIGGDPAAQVRARGPRAEVAAGHLADVLGLLLHHAHARHLTATAHEATVQAAYQELSAKNRRLLAAVDRLQEVDRLKSNFLATMSHELRTPLTSVIGYSEMLLEGLAGPLAAEQREYVSTILAKADQLLGLITAVLDVSLLESGRGAADPTPVALDEVVGSVVAAFAPQAQKRAIAIEIRGGAIAAVGDRRQIRQILWQLISNAVKFSPDQGRIDVELRRGPLAPEGGDVGVQIVVRDSGIGIAAEQLPHIFEPFFQVDQSSTRAFGGTGLGLALAKAYVESQGGRIWVDSTPGLGSTFTVSLPAAVGDAAISGPQGREG